MNRHLSLTVSFLMMVGVYHAYNFLHQGEFKLPFRWKSSSFQISWGEKIRAKIPAWTSTALSEYEFLDAASHRLSELGSLGKYFAGQRRFDIVYGPEKPVPQFFLREEIPVQFERASSLIENGFLKPLEPFRKELERQGVHLVVVPVPTKMSLYPKKVPHPLPMRFASEPFVDRGPECPQCVYRTLVDGAKDVVVDLQTRFAREVSENESTELFVPYDHQWTSRAVVLAGQLIIEKLKEQGLPVRVPDFRPTELVPPDHSKGMIKGLNLPGYFLLTRSFQWKEPRFKLEKAALNPLPGRLFMAGTCYSNRAKTTPYGLGRQLAESLGVPLVDFSEDGTHGVAALKAMNKAGYRLQRGDILVLEFAFRQPWDPNEKLPRLNFLSEKAPLG